MSQYNKLYTPQDSAVVFIDHQPQMIFGVANADRAGLINNVTLLAKVAKEFNVPTVLTAVETEGFSGYVLSQLLDVFPGQEVVERTSMNSWDSEGFRNIVVRARLVVPPDYHLPLAQWQAGNRLGQCPEHPLRQLAVQ